MLLVAEFETDRTPEGFNRRFCEALNGLVFPHDDAAVAVVTAQRGGRSVRRVECSDQKIARRLRLIIKRIDPALIGGAS